MAEKREVKDCPYCGEEILAKAIRCKHCKSDLDISPAGDGKQGGKPETASPPAPPLRPPASVPPPPPVPVASDQGQPPVPPPGSDRKEVSPGGSAAPPPLPGPPAVPPPPVPAKPAGGLYEYPKADIARRILAYIIDGVIGFLPLGILIPLAFIPFIRHSEMMSYGSFNSVPNVLGIAFAVIAGLIGLGWSLFYILFRDGFGAGQSWGKKVCGLMVVSLEDNSPCTRGKSFVRNIFAWIISVILSWVPFLNVLAAWAEPIVALVHARGHRVGDMVAKTQVIDLDQYNK
jgi:uncharacterized RDD family membrane protein YckC